MDKPDFQVKDNFQPCELTFHKLLAATNQRTEKFHGLAHTEPKQGILANESAVWWQEVPPPGSVLVQRWNSSDTELRQAAESHKMYFRKD